MTTAAKVLRTTTDQEDHENKEQNCFEITHSGNQSQDEEDPIKQPENHRISSPNHTILDEKHWKIV